MDRNVIKILLIEDDEDDFILTRELLKDIAGDRYLLRWAKSFHKALGLMTKNVASVYLVDYHLGTENGIDLVKKAREGGCTGPIIFITGENDRDLDTLALRSGATDYLIKGEVNGTTLEKSIRYALERHRAEQETKKLIAAEKGIELRDEFLNIASHELKTPLTSLQLQLQILEKKIHKKEHLNKEDLGVMIATNYRQIKRLAQLINNLLDVSRISSKRLDLDREKVEIGTIINDVLLRHEDAIQASGSRIEVTNGVTIEGMWDQFRLDQVFTNLISNAVKYGEGKPISITLEKKANKAIISVKDRGLGIPDEDKERIFDRFERTSVAKQYGGLGLGLYIVRQIVTAHNGSINVDSSPKKGSTFTVVLPLQ